MSSQVTGFDIRSGDYGLELSVYVTRADIRSALPPEPSVADIPVDLRDAIRRWLARLDKAGDPQ